MPTHSPRNMFDVEEQDNEEVNATNTTFILSVLTLVES
jgi:hypothetical protein